MRPIAPLALTVAFVLVGTMHACGGDAGRSDLAWVTEVDSTGDTIRIRITGEIPESRVHTLVSEMEVGAEDGSEEETFGGIPTLVPAGDGGVYVYDQQANAIRQFDGTGTFVRNIGRNGGGPGEFGQVNGLTRMVDGRFLVWDATNARINVYSDTGAFLTAWRVPFTSHFGQNMLWTGHDGRTYSWAVLKADTLDFTRGVRGVIVYDSIGTVIDSLPYPKWGDDPPSLIARSADGRSMTSFSFPFWPSTVAAISPAGGFVSGPGAPYLLYFTGGRAAKPIRVERITAPVPVSSTERREARQMVETGLRRLDPNWSWSGPDIPADKPAYELLKIDRDGRVWVELSTAAVPIPAAELPPVRPGEERRPRTTTRTPTVYDVFAADGRLLGRVAFPRRVAFHNASGDAVYAVRRDSSDVEYVVRYRVEPALPR